MVDGKIVKMQRGDVIAIATGVPHRVMVEEGDYERYSVVIHPKLIPKSALEEFRSSYILKKATPDNKIYRLLKKAERYSRELPREAQDIIYPALSLEIYYMMVRGDDGGETSSEPINRALCYIEEHCAEISSISEISDMLYISKSYFHALFKEHTGKTPHVYLTERRLHLARVRILSGERPTAIYRECGFDDYTSFYRSYKARYGISPGDTFSSDGENDF
jgi:AraC-like DNA-binding protein